MPDNWPDAGDLTRESLATKMAPSLVQHLDLGESLQPSNFRGSVARHYHLCRPGKEIALCMLKVGAPIEGNIAGRSLCKGCEFEFIKLVIDRCHP